MLIFKKYVLNSKNTKYYFNKIWKMKMRQRQTETERERDRQRERTSKGREQIIEYLEC